MWHTDFGITKEGEKAHRFLLTNNRGMCVELSDFGALVLSVYVLDRHGDSDRKSTRLNSSHTLASLMPSSA